MKLIVTIEGKDHTLSMEAAEELYEELGRVFQKEVVIRTNPLPVLVYLRPYRPFPIWNPEPSITAPNTQVWSSSNHEVSMRMVS